MVFFEWSATVSPSTTRTNAEKITKKVQPGVLTKWEFYFPPGCQQQVHAVLTDGIHQLVPFNPAQNIAGEGFAVNAETRIVLPDNPTLLTLEAWSEADTFDHTVTVRVEILQPEDIDPQAEFFGNFRKLLRRIGV